MTMTVQDVLDAVERSCELTPTQLRDITSGLSRLAGLIGRPPALVLATPESLRKELAGVKPAAHGISRKTFANLRALLARALGIVGLVDQVPRGLARRHPVWGALVALLDEELRLSLGTAAFLNWCAFADVEPGAVDDHAVACFGDWLATRTLHPQARDLHRAAPVFWNRAAAAIPGWPRTRLAKVSFRKPSSRVRWGDLPVSFREDAEAYIALRAGPDIFDERPNIPTRPLAERTLRQQREHLRLAASVLIASGVPSATLVSISVLVQPERFKAILRAYHAQAGGRASAFAVNISRTLLQVARFHSGASAELLAQLKSIAAKLPPVPFDLTEKNKAVLRRLESVDTRMRLLLLPETLLRQARDDLRSGTIDIVSAQVGIAVDILLVAPFRPQNLIAIDSRRHFIEPDGPCGPLILRIPAEETKGRRREAIFEIPEDVATRVRWYRTTILPLASADPGGRLFATRTGRAKTQATLSIQIIRMIERRLGFRMTPHQFRHFAATHYLEAHPDDFETIRNLLGHAFGKTTLIYAGSSTRRSAKAYAQLVVDQRAALAERPPSPIDRRSRRRRIPSSSGKEL